MIKNKKFVYGENITDTELISGSAFVHYIPFINLSLEATPGTQFYLNNNIYPITVGASGKYNNDIEIADLSFKFFTLDDLIINIQYEDKS